MWILEASPFRLGIAWPNVRSWPPVSLVGAPSTQAFIRSMTLLPWIIYGFPPVAFLLFCESGNIHRRQSGQILRWRKPYRGVFAWDLRRLGSCIWNAGLSLPPPNIGCILPKPPPPFFSICGHHRRVRPLANQSISLPIASNVGAHWDPHQECFIEWAKFLQQLVPAPLQVAADNVAVTVWPVPTNHSENSPEPNPSSMAASSDGDWLVCNPKILVITCWEQSTNYWLSVRSFCTLTNQVLADMNSMSDYY